VKKKALLLIVLLCLAVTVAALAADGYDLWWSVVGGGGGRVQSGGLTLEGTLGQPVAGEVGSGALTLCSGYWCAGPSPRNVYVPLVER